MVITTCQIHKCRIGSATSVSHHRRGVLFVLLAITGTIAADDIQCWAVGCGNSCPPTPDGSSCVPHEAPSCNMDEAACDECSGMWCAEPTGSPTASKVGPPTQRPISSPSMQPVSIVTHHPTARPTSPLNPGEGPTPRPSERPTHDPTHSKAPTRKPSLRPTHTPTRAPTRRPSAQPVVGSGDPSADDVIDDDGLGEFIDDGGSGNDDGGGLNQTHKKGNGDGGGGNGGGGSFSGASVGSITLLSCVMVLALLVFAAFAVWAHRFGFCAPHKDRRPRMDGKPMLQSQDNKPNSLAPPQAAPQAAIWGGQEAAHRRQTGRGRARAAALRREERAAGQTALSDGRSTGGDDRRDRRKKSVYSGGSHGGGDGGGGGRGCRDTRGGQQSNVGGAEGWGSNGDEAYGDGGGYGGEEEKGVVMSDFSSSPQEHDRGGNGHPPEHVGAEVANAGEDGGGGKGGEGVLSTLGDISEKHGGSEGGDGRQRDLSMDRFPAAPPSPHYADDCNEAEAVASPSSSTFSQFDPFESAAPRLSVGEAAFERPSFESAAPRLSVGGSGAGEDLDAHFSTFEERSSDSKEVEEVSGERASVGAVATANEATVEEVVTAAAAPTHDLGATSDEAVGSLPPPVPPDRTEESSEFGEAGMGEDWLSGPWLGENLDTADAEQVLPNNKEELEDMEGGTEKKKKKKKKKNSKKKRQGD